MVHYHSCVSKNSCFWYLIPLNPQIKINFQNSSCVNFLYKHHAKFKNTKKLFKDIKTDRPKDRQTNERTKTITILIQSGKFEVQNHNRHTWAARFTLIRSLGLRLMWSRLTFGSKRSPVTLLRRPWNTSWSHSTKVVICCQLMENLFFYEKQRQCRYYQNLTKTFKNLTQYLTNFTEKSDQNRLFSDHFYTKSDRITFWRTELFVSMNL